MRAFIACASLLLSVAVAVSAVALDVIIEGGEFPVFENTEHDHCTTITVGARASADGSTMTTHTNDCHQCDSRIFRVPARDHAEGEKRPIYMAENMEYPRYVGYSRGPGYYPQGNQTVDKPIGYIPQVPHTFAYFDGSYGIMNEHQVAIGESTCSAKLFTKPIGYGGKALFDIIELSRIALERARTAREAIQIIGGLAEEYGYYSQWIPEAYALEEAGETLTIIDPKEAWVLNILTDDTGTSAIWAAKRVPDDHVAVTANFFTIDEVEENNPDWYMHSKNVFEVAKAKGWWDPSKERFSFVKAYSPIEEDSRDKDYWIVRMWRVFDIIAPSLKLSPDVETVLDLPFSVKPEKPVTAADIMRMNRDLYEGTEFDLTKGVAAGPYGSPLRMDGPTWGMKGEWARAISLMRTAYSTVLQCRSWLPDAVGGVFWLGEDAPHSTLYIPFFAGADDTGPSFTQGSMHKFTRNAWWAFDFLSNYIELKWNYMIRDVRAKQDELEKQQFAALKQVEDQYVELSKKDPAQAAAYVTEWTRTNAEKLVATWWEFADYMVTKYNDGYINFPKVGGTTGYPAWWLRMVGYDMDPRYKVIVNTTLQLPNGAASPTPDVPPLVPRPAAAPAAAAAQVGATVHMSTFALVSVAVAVVGVTLGFVVGRAKRQHVRPAAETAAGNTQRYAQL